MQTIMPNGTKTGDPNTLPNLTKKKPSFLILSKSVKEKYQCNCNIRLFGKLFYKWTDGQQKTRNIKLKNVSTVEQISSNIV